MIHSNSIRESFVWVSLLLLAHHDPTALTVGMGIIVMFGDWYWCYVYRATHHDAIIDDELHQLHLEHIAKPRLYRIAWVLAACLFILWDICK